MFLHPRVPLRPIGARGVVAFPSDVIVGPPLTFEPARSRKEVQNWETGEMNASEQSDVESRLSNICIFQ